METRKLPFVKFKKLELFLRKEVSFLQMLWSRLVVSQNKSAISYLANFVVSYRYADWRMLAGESF